MLKKQLEIQFFWPLTEQIPLDLDYSNCIPEKQLVTSDCNSLFLANGGTITTAPVTWSNKIVLQARDIEVEWQKETEPRWWTKLLFKLLDIKLSVRDKK